MTEIGKWLTPVEIGYYAIGYDEFVNPKAPVWHAVSADLAKVASAAVQFCHDAIEVENVRRVDIYFCDADGRVQGPDITMKTEK